MLKRFHYAGYGTINCSGPFHLGTGDEDVGLGALVERDEAGRPLLRATAIAGVLDQTARVAALLAEYEDRIPCSGNLGATETCECVRCRLLGNTTTAPSALWLYDAALAEGEKAVTEVRDHVGLGRATGAGANQRLFDQEVVCGGALSFPFSLRLDEEDDPAARLLLDALRIWERWGGQIGAQAGSGLGRFEYSQQIGLLDLNDDQGLAAYAVHGDSQELVQVAEVVPDLAAPARRPWHQVSNAFQCRKERPPEALRLHLRLRPTEPFMVKTDFDDADLTLTTVDLQGNQVPSEPVRVDHGFVKTTHGGQDTHYVPGSSLRGVVRSACERVLRTRLRPMLGEDRYQSFPHTVICDPHGDHGDDTPKRLWKCEVNKRDRDDVHRIEEQICLACRLFGSSDLGGRVRVTEAYPDDAQAFDAHLKLLQHVALDRVDGGAAGSRLFNERPVYPEPEATNLDMTFTIELVAPDLWEVALLLLLLRDMEKGRLRIGYGKRRGLGKVRATLDRVEALAVEGATLSEALPKDRADLSCCFPFVYYDIPVQDGIADPAVQSLFAKAATEWENTLKEYSERLLRAEEVGASG